MSDETTKENAGAKKKSPPEHLIDFADVLDAELEVVDRLRRNRLKGDETNTAAESDEKPAAGAVPYDVPYHKAHFKVLSGLAFSGGGIRSATFNLGVLQVLARIGLLQHIDYLSTVSGGGYIGSWLATWIHRSGAEAVREGLKRELPEIETDRPSSPREPERKQSPITFLRTYSNYLTPRKGLFSLDTWMAIATYLRNFTLNLTILVLVVGAVLLLPRVFLAAALSGVWTPVHFAVAPFCVILALIVMALNVDPDFLDRRFISFFTKPGSIIALVVLPLFVAGIFAAYGLPQIDLGLGDTIVKSALLYAAVWFGSLVVWLAFLGPIKGWKNLGKYGWRDAMQRWVAAILWALAAGAAGGWALWALSGQLPQGAVALATFGPPLVVVVLLFAGILHTGLMGRFFLERNRQWWSRLGGWLGILAVGWLALFAVTFYGPPIPVWLGRLASGTLTAGWLVSTAAGVWAARSPATNGANSKPSLELVAKVAPYIFVIGLLILLSNALQRVQPGFIDWVHDKASTVLSKEHADTADLKEAQSARGRLLRKVTKEGHQSFGTILAADLKISRAAIRGHGRETALLFALLLSVGVFLSWRVDINAFSMHLFYRNRLVRPYLGASRHKRDPRKVVPFTGFDPLDDVPLHQLSKNAHECQSADWKDLSADGWTCSAPFPIINTALNLTAGKNLAWQERKANSFFFTPLYSGYDWPAEDGSESGACADPRCGAFHLTRDAYRGQGVSIGTAMAISGAAVNPNMGYHSSRPLAFLMTVFNARLGWWIGNPRKPKKWKSRGPGVGLWRLLQELTGRTRETSSHVNLADGGFFDNTGIYELVRRRCRFIIACDAEADPKLRFGGLGNAIRRSRADFGIDIEIDVEPIRRQMEGGSSKWHCAVGRIHYDHRDERAPEGTILYIKASLTGDEPADIQNYAAQHDDFPHETTADQWFTESQFESYRALGHHAAGSAFAPARVDDREPINVEEMVVRLGRAWYPPTRSAPGSFTRHAKLLDEIFERLRQSDDLDFLHAEIYPELEQRPGNSGAADPDSGDAEPAKNGSEERELAALRALTPAQFNAGFYLCNSVSQLMENVYLDLNLEQEWNHPDNRGWLNLFKHWSWSPMFRLSWAISASTCGSRFQRFCEERLSLRAGLLCVRKLGSDWDDSRLLSRLEKDLLDQLGGGFDEVAVGRLAVPARRRMVEVTKDPSSWDPADPGDTHLEFTFGFAALKGPELVYIRVRDHLLKLDLERTLMNYLLSSGATESVSRRPRGDLLPVEEVSSEEVRNIFKSIRNELRQEKY